jgi:hypothetical protein
MADEKKLGPNVTYVGNDENDKQAVTMMGIRFKPGEAVNLEERLGATRAKPVLQKLIGNTYFKVDGGPDHRKQQEAKAKAEEEENKQAQEDAEEEEQMRLERENPPPAETSNESGGGRRRGSRGGAEQQ